MTKEKALSWSFYGWMAILAIGILIGLWGTATLLFNGHGTLGTSDQIPWGVFVPTYIFFVAASAGCVIVALGYALGIKGLALVMKRTIFLGIVTLLCGGLMIILDIGSPQSASIRFFFSPNLQSPMWWLSVFYLLYLILLVVEFVLIHQHKVKQIQVVGVFAGLTAIAVHSTLGALFGFSSVRTYFAGAISPIYFMAIAVIIGMALLLFAIILQYKVTREEMSPELRGIVVGLGKFLGIMVGVAIFFTIWKDLTGVNSTVHTTALAYEHILASWWYWVMVILMGLVIPIFLLLNPGTRSPNGILIASILLLIGMFAARVEFTIGGQMVALVPNLQHLQAPLRSYSPTFVEIAVVVFIFALAALLYTLGTKKLALEEVPHHD
jgi:molybdopterin-containing oxidoreductase family membrane subunit